MDRALPITAWTPPSLSRELRLLARCCHASFNGQVAAEASLDHPLDWGNFLALAARHRVVGLAWHGLKSLGIEHEFIRPGETGHNYVKYYEAMPDAPKFYAKAFAQAK